MPPKVPFKKQPVPSAPTGLSVSGETISSFQLSWESSALDLTDFQVYLDGVLYLDEIDPEVRTVAVTGLDDGRTYSVQMAARNGAGVSSLSDAISVTTIVADSVVITQQPQSTTVNEGDDAVFSVTGQNITSYQWYRNTGAGFSAMSGETNSTLTISAAPASASGYTYYCEVSNAYSVQQSSTVTLTVQATGLSAPTTLSAALISGPAVRLTWTDNASGETGYKIYRDGNWVTPIATIAADSTSYDDSTVSLGNSYSYRVAAYDGSSTVFSSIVNISLADATILFSPTDEYVADGQTARFAVSVDPDAGSPTYQWEYSDNGGTSWADASGATNAMIEVVGDNATNNGRIYRCKVTTGAGTATSGSATLTVYAHSYHLDTNAAVGAWSFKKIRSAYSGSCCRVKKTNGEEMDVGFSSGTLDVATLEAWLSGASAELLTLYDQSGNGRDAVLTGGNGPWIALAGTALVDSLGHVYSLGRDKDAYWEVDYTSAPIDATDVSAMMAVSLDVEKNRENALYSASRPFILFGGVDGYTIATNGAIRYDDASTTENIASVDPWNVSWIGLRFSDEENRIYQSLKYIYDSDRQVWRTNRSSSHTNLRFTAMIGMCFRELIVYGANCTETQYRDRQLLADRNYRYGPPNADYANFLARTWWHHKLWQRIDATVEDDVAFPRVTAKTANSITVGGVDWSYLPTGKRFYVWADQFTVASGGATYDGTNTTINVSEDASNVEVGTEVVASPHYDQSITDLESAVLLERLWNGDGSPALHDVLAFPAHYYLLTPGGNTYDISPTRTAIIDSAQPNTAGLTGGISDDGTNWRVMLMEFDLSSVAERPEFTAITFTGIDHTHDGNDNRPYIGVKMFADAPFDATTVTWNTSPVTLTPKPAYDDLESPDEVEDWAVFDLAEAFLPIYDGGASTVTVAVYFVNEQYDRPLTDRTVTLTGPNLQINAKFGIGIEPNGRLFELDDHQGGGGKNQHIHGGHAGPVIYESSIPLSGGGQGNPYYHYAPLAVKSLIHNTTNLAMMTALSYGDGDVRANGGILHMTGPIMAEVGSMMDEATRIAIEEAFYSAAYRYRWSTQSLFENANVTCKGIEGCADAWAGCRSSNTRVRTMIEQALKFWTFGSTSGQIDSEPYAYDRDYAMFTLWGNCPEGDKDVFRYRTPEIDYGGRSNAHLAKAMAVTYSDSEFDVLDEISERCIKFIAATMADDGPNGWVGCAGFSGRTDGAPFPIAQNHDFGYLTWAIRFPAHRWLAKELSTGQSMVPWTVAAANSAAATAINARTFGPLLDRDFSTIGPGTRTFPDRYKNIGAAWPSLVWTLPDVSWVSTLKTAFDADAASTYYLGHIEKNWSETVEFLGADGEDTPILLVQKGTTPSRYKALIYAPEYLGAYGGAAWGHIDLFEVEGYGPVVCNIKVSTSSDYYGSPSSDYSPWLHDACDIIGVDAADGYFRWASGKEESLASRSWDAGTNTVTTTKQISPTRANPPGLQLLPTDISWIATHEMRVMNPAGADAVDGIEGSITLDYVAGGGGTDQIKELFLQFPLFVSKTSTSSTNILFVDYWSGSSWLPIVERGTWSVTAQHLRLRRDRGDGGGWKYAYISFDTSRAIYIYPTDTRKNGQVTRRLWVNMHPNRGTATNIPSSLMMSYTISPETELADSGGAVASFVVPDSNALVHTSMMWLLKAYVNWGSTTAGTAVFQYSTDYAGDEGAATWTTIGTAWPDSGVNETGNYSFAGGTTPSGVTALRVQMTPVAASASTSVLAVTATATTEYVADSFTDSDAVTMTAHTPDVDVSGGGWLVGYDALSILSNRAAPGLSVPDNGCFSRIAIGGGEDYMVSAKVYAPSWNTGEIYYGPWIGGRGRNYNSDGVRVALGNAGVTVSHRKAGVTSWSHTASGDFVPSAATEYTLRMRFIADGVGWELSSSDGLTVHDSGTVWGCPTGFSSPEPCVGFTRRVVGQYIDDVSIRK